MLTIASSSAIFLLHANNFLPEREKFGREKGEELGQQPAHCAPLTLTLPPSLTHHQSPLPTCSSVLREPAALLIVSPASAAPNSAVPGRTENNRGDGGLICSRISGLRSLGRLGFSCC